MGIFWPLALIWAFTGMPGRDSNSEKALRAEVADLSERVRVLEEEKNGRGELGSTS